MTSQFNFKFDYLPVCIFPYEYKSVVNKYIKSITPETHSDLLNFLIYMKELFPNDDLRKEALMLWMDMHAEAIDNSANVDDYVIEEDGNKELVEWTVNYRDKASTGHVHRIECRDSAEEVKRINPDWLLYNPRHKCYTVNNLFEMLFLHCYIRHNWDEQRIDDLFESNWSIDMNSSWDHKYKGWSDRQKDELFVNSFFDFYKYVNSLNIKFDNEYHLFREYAKQLMKIDITPVKMNGFNDV